VTSGFCRDVDEILNFLTLEGGIDMLSKESVKDYNSTLPNISEEGRSHVRVGTRRIRDHYTRVWEETCQGYSDMTGKADYKKVTRKHAWGDKELDPETLCTSGISGERSGTRKRCDGLQATTCQGWKVRDQGRGRTGKHTKRNKH
jgi:hypothetical protein